MINGYLEFREERDEARLRMREHIRSQTIDNSRRGESTRLAIQNIVAAKQSLLRYYQDSLASASIRDAWKIAYRDQRIRDRTIRNVTSVFSTSLMKFALDRLFEPRKIDMLIGASPEGKISKWED
jgi:hypothetical protein